MSKSMVVRLKRTGPTAALVQSSLINANGRTFFSFALCYAVTGFSGQELFITRNKIEIDRTGVGSATGSWPFEDSFFFF